MKKFLVSWSCYSASLVLVCDGITIVGSGNYSVIKQLCEPLQEVTEICFQLPNSFQVGPVIWPSYLDPIGSKIPTAWSFHRPKEGGFDWRDSRIRTCLQVISRILLNTGR